MRAGDKSSIFLVLLGWQRGLPSTTWLWQPCLCVPGWPRPRPRRPGPRNRWTMVARDQAPEGLLDGGWHLGTACWPAAPALLCLPRGPAGRVRDTVFTSLLLRTSASCTSEHGWSQSTPEKVHTCRGLQKTLQDHTARWTVFALRLGGEAAQEAPHRLLTCPSPSERKASRAPRSRSGTEMGASIRGQPYSTVSRALGLAGTPHSCPTLPSPARAHRRPRPGPSCRRQAHPWPRCGCTATPAECPEDCHRTQDSTGCLHGRGTQAPPPCAPRGPVAPFSPAVRCDPNTQAADVDLRRTQEMPLGAMMSLQAPRLTALWGEVVGCIVWGSALLWDNYTIYCLS
ncbi:uncharacterized protein [Sagmatias obliquidens]|uniref:uncharacterized protein isoform X5 n=1 Tax=Sagmatias obliquidens TaxID=3371155 RepID=UPI000F4421EC|nr:uncharacterized protein LOC113621156 isoform X5 [Lagenorhynchus obliquidens]